MATQTAATTALDPRAIDVRAERAKPDLRRFAMLAVPLALLLVVFRTFGLEEPAFFRLACLMFGGFAVSYWLPFRYKEVFFIALSLGGAYVLLAPAVATLLIAVGLAMFALIASRLPFGWKIAGLCGILACGIYGRAGGWAFLPREFWPVFGAVFMFRMIIYLYDISHKRGPLLLKDYVSYFFLLPNYYFLFFPVIDFQTFRSSYFRRDIHDVALRGVQWIFRGTTHLLLYRVIYQTEELVSPPHVPVAVAVIVKSFFAYVIYLRISGQFHIIAGMLCLFGYDLPETNHLYLLANSVADMWRRINIYWKDFMVKIFYFPTYFKLRRKGDFRAQLIGTVLVFVATWFLHAVQFFWIQGKFLVSVIDTIFWVVLGSLVVADVWLRNKRPKRIQPKGAAYWLLNTAKIAATLVLMSALWSMWSVKSLSQWFYFLKSGNI